VFGVIILHVAAVPVTRFAQLPSGEWAWANAYDALVRPCIPVFIMISGSLLLTRAEWNVSSFVRSRILRVGVPFVAWSLLYAAWSGLVHDKPVGFGRFFYHLAAGMTDPVYTHLWYLPLILSLYLLFPILRVYVANASAAGLVYFGALWFFASAVRPLIETGLGIPIGYYLTPVVGYVGYFVLGAALRSHAPDRLPARWLAICAGVFVIAYAVTALGTYQLTVRNSGTLDETLYSHFAPNVAAMSLTVFALLRHAGAALERGLRADSPVLRFTAFMGTASFGVYLVHMMVLELFSYGWLGFSLGPLSFHPAMSIPITALVIFVVSLAISGLMRQSRLLRWLSP
jgi:surface polysaccharide O-acyltransferase-like enzyme